MLVFCAAFCFLNTGKGIGWEERIQGDPFPVSSDTLNLNHIQCSAAVQCKTACDVVCVML